MIKKITLTALLILFLNGCNYQPIYSSKNDPLEPGEKGDESAKGETPKRDDDDQHDDLEVVTESLEKYILIEDMRIPLDEGVKFNNFLKDWSKKTKQPFEKVKSAMTNKNTFSIPSLLNNHKYFYEVRLQKWFCKWHA